MCSTGQLITALFGLVLALSIQDAAAQGCPFSTLTNKDNAMHNAPMPLPNPPVAAAGDMIRYTCATGHRIAPDLTPSDTFRDVECGSVTPGVFSDLNFECVPTNPTSCRDYFTRDGILPTILDDVCHLVTISHPDGTTTIVECCRVNAGRFRTQIPTVGNTDGITVAGACTTGGNALDIMPGVMFDGTISKLCEGATPITYALTEAEIRKVVETTQGCSQRVRFHCHNGAATGTTSKAIIIRYNGDDVGTLFGTNAFLEQDVDIDLSHYGNAGAACDCALENTEADNDCVDGCHCTLMGTEASVRDTITRTITPTNLKYVNAVRISQHNSEITDEDTTFDVKEIRCNEDL